MDCNNIPQFHSKIKPTSTSTVSKANGFKLAKPTTTVHSTNQVTSLAKPRTLSTINHQANNQARPTSPKITKRINSSSLVQPTNTFISSNRPTNNVTTSRLATASQQAHKLSSTIKKPGTFHNNSTQSGVVKPLTVNSSCNRLAAPQLNSKLANSRTSSSSSIIKGREPKKLVKDSINNSSFVPREKLEKLVKKHEELTNKYNYSSQVISRNQLAVDALACLVNYMSVDLDAFECPNLKKRSQYLESVEQGLRLDVSNLQAENKKMNSELDFERHRALKEKENLLEMFEVEMKSAEKTYTDNMKVEQTKREKVEKDLLYLKQNLSKDKKIEFLNKEIESLKTVLDLRESELKELRYKLDRTWVDKDEISQLRNERDNLSLAKEQLEYSLNMKNEELKFVLQESSLASLGSLTSTPMNNDRNNNVVKKRKTTAKKQKLDSTEKDDDVFLKPMNLHRERFTKTTEETTSAVDVVDNCNDDNGLDHCETDCFERNEDEEMMKTSLNNDRPIDEEFLQQQLDEEFDFVKPLVNKEHSFTKSPFNCSSKSQVFDHMTNHLDGEFLNKDAPSDEANNFEINTSSLERVDKMMETSFPNKHSMEIRDDDSSSQPFDNMSQDLNDKISDHKKHDFTSLTQRKKEKSRSSSISENDNDTFSKSFDLNLIRERCFAKPIDKMHTEYDDQNSSLNKSDNSKCGQLTIENVATIVSHSDSRQNRFESNPFIKTCQIVNDENEISIIKTPKKLEPGSVLDSGFCDL